MTPLRDMFTLLDNKTIGRNLYNIRKINDIKAMEIAEHIGITESAYTKYERGESKITIEFIQKVAAFLKVDPIGLIGSTQGHIIENIQSSTLFSQFETFKTYNEKQNEMMLKLMESILEMNKKLIELMGKKG